jgi:site-specific DNA recombinase
MPATTGPQRAALYARFSSDLQKDRSVDDQLDLCRRYAASKGHKVVAEYFDRAKSASTLFDRTGAIDLMRAVMRREFDCVIVENLDRLSRDQEDLAGMFKRMRHHGVTIDTLNEGTATPLHVGLRGLLGQIYLADHGERVRGRLSVLVREGKTAGGRVYGYRPIAGKSGQIEVDPEAAKIIRRIFSEYAAGGSPRAIAKRLNDEGVPAPVGAEWINTSFVGSKVSPGILRHELYVGVRVWNRTSRSKNPDNGQERKTVRPASEWHRVAVPHLRIVDDELWHAAQAVANGRAVHRFGPGGTIARRPFIQTSPHLLAGVLRCAACGSPMRMSNGAPKYGPRMACAAAARPSKQTVCTHRRSYSVARLQALIVDALDQAFADPEAIARAVKGYHAQFAKRDRERRGEHDAARKRLANIEAAKLRLVDALEKTTTPVDVIVEKINALEAERAGLAERVRLGGSDYATVTILHPKARQRFLDGIKILKAAIRSDELAPGARVAFHNVVEAVEVHPVDNRAPYRITPYLRHAALIGGLDLFPKGETAHQIIEARAGKLCATMDGPSDLARHHRTNGKPLNLGVFTERRAA